MFKKLLLSIFLFTTISIAQNITGAGTVGDPYILYNYADVDSMRYLGVENVYYELGANITATPDTYFKPLLDTIYTGTIYDVFLNGNDYELIDFQFWLQPDMNQTYYMGFYGGTIGINSRIQNLVIRNWSIEKTAVFSGAEGSKYYTWFGRIEGTSEGSGYQFQNIRVIGCTIDIDGSSSPSYYTTGTSTAVICGLVGSTSTGTIAHGNFYRVDFDSCTINVTLKAFRSMISAMISTNIGLLVESSVRNSYISINNLTTTTSALVAIPGKIDALVGEDELNDCYFYNNIVSGSGNIGVMNNGLDVNRVYAAKNSSIDGVARYAWNSTGDMNSTDCYFDTLGGNWTNLYSGTGTPKPILKPPDSLKIIETFTNWDFDLVWGKSAFVNDGFPYLTWMDPYIREIDILIPETNDFYGGEDTVFITWTQIAVDTALIYYTSDAGVTWIPLDTVETTDTTTYEWTDWSASGPIQITITNLDSTVWDTSGVFFMYETIAIQILSPLDSITVNNNGNLTVDIIVQTMNIDQFSLYYAVNDTVSWIPIVYDLPTNGLVDTITYEWDIPYIYGEIWILAREISDTTIYDFERGAINIGNTLRTQPLICWYYTSYFGTDFIDYQQEIVEINALVDRRCGWSSPPHFEKVTTIINDKADGYTFIVESDANRDSIMYAIQAGGTFLIEGEDTTFYRYNDFYTHSTPIVQSVTYKNRIYYVSEDDSVLYCDDIVNGIEGIYILNLVPFIKNWSVGITSGWSDLPDRLQIYHVQRSKIDSLYFASDYDFESLNDSDFEPVLLINGPDSRRGRTTIVMEALPEPNQLVYVQDIARIFTQLDYTRDYFRGIHPKAEKRNDPNWIGYGIFYTLDGILETNNGYIFFVED